VSNWLCCAAISHIFLDNENMRTELLRVQLSTVAGSPPVSLLSQTVKILQHTTSMVTRLGVLQLLCSWVTECPPAVSQLLQSQDSLSFLLNQIGSNEHDETERLGHGLCSVLLGLAILNNDGSVSGHTAEDLTTLVEKRVGSDVFLDKIGDIPKHETYIRALKSPQVRCNSTTELTFDHMFCELFRSIDRDITTIMAKKTSQSPLTNGSGEAAEETGTVEVEQYKNFIREQDTKMQQYVEANTLLHTELTNIRAQYEEVYGTVQQLRDQNAILQAQAINAVTSSPVEQQSVSQQQPGHGDGLKMEDQERRLKQQEEYIQELEARIVKEDKTVTDVNENLAQVVNYSQTQALELTNLKQQLEGMRGIVMNKDEEIMKLKNDLPLRKSDKPVDRFENMFMTSMEVEAQKKSLGHLEMQLKTEEITRLKDKHEEEIKDLEKERDTIEKELLDTKHKVDALEELTQDLDKDTVAALECELRDARCKLEELQDMRDAKSLDAADSSQLQILLKETEERLGVSTEELTNCRDELSQASGSLQSSRLEVETLKGQLEQQLRDKELLEQRLKEREQPQQQLGDQEESEKQLSNQKLLEQQEKEKELLEQQLRDKDEQLVSVTSEQEDLLVMLADQEEKLTKLRQRLKDLGQEVPEEEEEDDLA